MGIVFSIWVLGMDVVICCSGGIVLFCGFVLNC